MIMPTLYDSTRSDQLRAAAPKALRGESDGCSTPEFQRRYGERPGPLQLTGFSSTGHSDGAFTITVQSPTAERTVLAAGSPVAALTSALYELGYPVEILHFHQRRTPSGTATFVQCEYDGRRAWGAALAGDGAESSVRAMLTSVNALA